MKILVWCDTPTGFTGFSTVSKNVLKILHEAKIFEDIDIVGINQFETYYDQQEFPYRIYNPEVYPSGDIFGKEKLKHVLLSNEYDFLFVINNLTVIREIFPIVREKKKKSNMKFVAYVPIEQDFLIKSQVDGLNIIDKLVLYHRRAEDLILEYDPNLKGKTTWIPHGTDINSFYRLPNKDRSYLRSKYFGIKDEDFLVMNINRNQWRKNLFDTILGFIFFKSRIEKDNNAKLYLHTNRIDVGGIIDLQIESAMNIVEKSTGFKFNINDIRLPDPKQSNGVSAEVLNRIYNCADLLISTSFGEGWGLTTTEAMACKVPVLVPKHTANLEIIGEDEERGFFIENNEFEHMQYGSSDIARKGIDMVFFINRLNSLYKSKDIRISKVGNAYKYILKNTWENWKIKWINLFK